MTGLRLHKLLPALHFIRHLGKRVYRDDITVLAGHLAYVSLLSLVPLVTVIFALFAAFPVFSDVSVELRYFIFTNFMPATGDVIQRYLEQFILNSSRMTAVGTCGLIVTALLLIYSVDTVLNSIWRSKNKRPVIFSFAVYWMVLTLGPLLAGASMVLSSYLFSLTWLNVSGATNGVLTLLLRIFPLLLSCASFWLLYSLVPTVRVPARDALVGALVAGALFELGKKRVLAVCHPVSLLPADLRGAGGDPHSVSLGVLELVHCIIGGGDHRIAERAPAGRRASRRPDCKGY